MSTRSGCKYQKSQMANIAEQNQAIGANTVEQNQAIRANTVEQNQAVGAVAELLRLLVQRE